MNPEILGESLPLDETVEVPEWHGARSDVDAYKALHAKSLSESGAQWEALARELEWSRSLGHGPLSAGDHPHVYEWFRGGRLNLSHLALDRHVEDLEEEQGCAHLGGRADRTRTEPRRR